MKETRTTTTQLYQVMASRPAAWLFARILPPLDRLVYRLSRGNATLSGGLGILPMVTIQTTGARTGLTRTVPLGAIHDPLNKDVFAVIGTNFGQQRLPAWYYNIRANSRVLATRNGHTQLYQAREAAPGEEYDRLWHRGVQIYPGYAIYKQRIAGRPIPILVFTPLD